MSTWPSRSDAGGDNNYPESQTAYANVPTSPSPMDNLHPPLRSPNNNGNGRSSYVSSPLNPNAGPVPRSRPPSWGPHAALEPQRTAASSVSEGIQNAAKDDKDTIRNVMTGAVGSGYGPYAVRHACAGNIFFALVVWLGLLTNSPVWHPPPQN